jgi:hypothetical protein
MTTEERLAAIERELAAIRDARSAEAYIHTKALPGLAQAMYELEAATEAANRKQAHLTEQFGTHAEWLAAHTQAIADLDARIDKLVSAIGQLLTRPQQQ